MFDISLIFGIVFGVIGSLAIESAVLLLYYLIIREREEQRISKERREMMKLERERIRAEYESNQLDECREQDEDYYYE